MTPDCPMKWDGFNAPAATLPDDCSMSSQADVDGILMAAHKSNAPVRPCILPSTWAIRTPMSARGMRALPEIAG